MPRQVPSPRPKRENCLERLGCLKRRPAFAALTLGLACVIQGPPAQAQTIVTVTGTRLNALGVAGFGDTPSAEAPLQAGIFGSAQLSDRGVVSLGAVTRLDASLGDAYNAEGYWAIVSARGFTLDNRFNYRRDGLPINAETALALDNKERIELLKGTSGIQAGTSAPGGLVNLVVKRPQGRIRSATLESAGAGRVLLATDLGDRFGEGGRVGLRLNAAAERLDPPQRNTRGERALLALAADWQIGEQSLLQAEIELSRQRQPSVVGFSLLGDRVPSAGEIDPRLNLNDQPWRQPVVFEGRTASLRWRQQIGAGWQLTLHAMHQHLRSDDRTAFPYGVYDASYACPQWCDRFAPDGSFTYWQYVSDGERRTSDAASATFAGRALALGAEHRLEAGVLTTRYSARFGDQVFDIAGTGRIDGSVQTLPSAGGVSAGVDRDERSVEWFARDAVDLTAGWRLFAGLRVTRLERQSRLTIPAADALADGGYAQGFTTPWLALTHTVAPGTMVYASWGRGLESDAAPSRSRYTNPGATFALASRQAEVGIRHSAAGIDAGAALFDIVRPQTSDVGSCDAPGTCTRIVDGTARHRGLELSAAWQGGPWQLQGSAMWLQARREGSVQPGVDGTTPVNVPRQTLRLGVEHSLRALPGFALLANLSQESGRQVLPYDAGATVPGWWRLDLAARWRQTLDSGTLTWRFGLDNATDRRAWKESPYQFGHAYLYPTTPRTWRISSQLSF